MGKIIAKLAANVAFVRAAAVTAAIVLPGLLSLMLRGWIPAHYTFVVDTHDRRGLLRCGAAEGGRRALHPDRQAGRRARAGRGRCGRVGEMGAGRGLHLDGWDDPRLARGRGCLHGLGRRAGGFLMPSMDVQDHWQAYLRSICDPRERQIEWARIYGMKSPLSFAERKARRIQRKGG